MPGAALSEHLGAGRWQSGNLSLGRSGWGLGLLVRWPCVNVSVVALGDRVSGAFWAAAKAPARLCVSASDPALWAVS